MKFKDYEAFIKRMKTFIEEKASDKGYADFYWNIKKGKEEGELRFTYEDVKITTGFKYGGKIFKVEIIFYTPDKQFWNRYTIASWDNTSNWTFNWDMMPLKAFDLFTFSVMKIEEYFNHKSVYREIVFPL